MYLHTMKESFVQLWGLIYLIALSKSAQFPIKNNMQSKIKIIVLYAACWSQGIHLKLFDALTFIPEHVSESLK